jgi:hypothetical protein
VMESRWLASPQAEEPVQYPRIRKEKSVKRCKNHENDQTRASLVGCCAGRELHKEYITRTIAWQNLHISERSTP